MALIIAETAESSQGRRGDISEHDPGRLEAR
jgi:hypothetical protein